MDKKTEKQRPITLFGWPPAFPAVYTKSLLMGLDSLLQPSLILKTTTERNANQLRDPEAPRIVKLRRTKAGFGFYLHGTNSYVQQLKFKPTTEVPALQYVTGVEKGGEANTKGIRIGDFILKVNDKNVTTVTHDHVVELIKHSGASVTLTVVTVPQSPATNSTLGRGDWTLFPDKYGFMSRLKTKPRPFPPSRDPSTTLTMCRMRSSSQLSLHELGMQHSFEEPSYSNMDSGITVSKENRWHTLQKQKPSTGKESSIKKDSSSRHRSGSTSGSSVSFKGYHTRKSKQVTDSKEQETEIGRKNSVPAKMTSSSAETVRPQPKLSPIYEETSEHEEYQVQGRKMSEPCRLPSGVQSVQSKIEKLEKQPVSDEGMDTAMSETIFRQYTSLSSRLHKQFISDNPRSSLTKRLSRHFSTSDAETLRHESFAESPLPLKAEVIIPPPPAPIMPPGKASPVSMLQLSSPAAQRKLSFDKLVEPLSADTDTVLIATPLRETTPIRTDMPDRPTEEHPDMIVLDRPPFDDSEGDVSELLPSPVAFNDLQDTDENVTDLPPLPPPPKFCLFSVGGIPGGVGTDELVEEQFVPPPAFGLEQENEVDRLSPIDIPAAPMSPKQTYSIVFYENKPVLEWSCNDVCNWLDSIGMSQYRETFEVNHIQGIHLPKLTKAELRELGVKSLGHRLTIESSSAQLCLPMESSC